MTNFEEKLEEILQTNYTTENRLGDVTTVFYLNKAIDQIKQSLLQLILDEVIGEDILHEPRIINAPHALGCRNCRVNKDKESIRQRAREMFDIR